VYGGWSSRPVIVARVRPRRNAYCERAACCSAATQAPGEEESEHPPESGAQKAPGTSARAIVAFTLPALGIYLTGPFLSMVDTCFVGLGPVTQLAALMPASLTCDGALFLFSFLGTATTGLVTREVKRGKEQAQRIVATAIFIAFCIGATCSILSQTVAAEWCVRALGASDALVPDAVTYVRLRGISFFGAFVNSVANSANLGVRDSLTPFKVTALGGLLNAVLDYIFVIQLGMGIGGAALATSIAVILSLALSVRALHRKELLPPFKSLIRVPTVDQVLPFTSYFGPLFFIILNRAFSFGLLTNFAAALSVEALAAHQVIFSVFVFFALICEPVSAAAQAYLPNLLDQGKAAIVEARRVFHKLLLATTCIAASSGLIEYLLLMFGTSLFTSDATVMAQVRQIAPLMLVIQASVSLNIVSEGTLIAGKNLRLLVYMTLISMLCLVLSLTTCTYSGIGLIGIWLSYGARMVSFLIGACYALVRRGLLL